MKAFPSIFVVLLLLYVTWAKTNSLNYQDSSKEQRLYVSENKVAQKAEDNQNQTKVAVLRRPKRILGIIAGVVGGLLLGGIMGGRGSGSGAAENYQKQMQISLEQLCHTICATEWSDWKPCDKPCGGGYTSRERNHTLTGKCVELKNFQCLKSLTERRPCNEGCPNGGTPSNTGCSCLKGWSGTCCTRKNYCKYPGRPQNGMVYVKTPAEYNTVATFSCDDGYAMSGSDMMRCNENGAWEGAKPTCTKMQCATPGLNKTKSASIINREDTYDYGDQVFYECGDGYVIRGPEMRTCRKGIGSKGKWDGFDPYCVAVKCGDPGLPINGQRNGTNFQYRGVVDFSCAKGYKLVGYQSMTCMANGKWLGRTPECVQIECDSPLAPKNGDVRIRSKKVVGTLVTFTCDEGYVMEGPGVLKCEHNGRWNGTEPFCKAAKCGDPDIPQNGAKDGSVYYYPHKVSYTCFTGYMLQGAAQITCQPNGQWSNTKPTCQACGNNTYMDDLEKPGVCQQCPQFTHTLTEGSTSRRQCVCNHGYEGLPGGPCTEVKCETLYAPIQGIIDGCDNKLGSSCTFGCVDGYFISRGSSTRTCQDNGQWDGSKPTCSACPANTYKFDTSSCMPCPVNSHTNSTGNMKEGCVCDDGFQGPDGGPCTDINECLANGGKGPCQDTCENRKGSYKCGCSIPGYLLDEDQHSCKVGKQCTNLTSDDAPENGGLVCHWYREVNSQQCGIRCNKGYEFPTRVNIYETCGPTTNYVWSFRRDDPKAVLRACIPELFPGFQSEPEVYYFSTDCKSLNSSEKRAVYENFKKILDENGICKLRQNKVCNVEDMGIICGKRRKRALRNGSLEYLTEVNIAFKVDSLKLGDDPKKDCPRICRFLRIPPDYCDEELCIASYKRFLRAAVIYTSLTLKKIYKSPSLRQRMHFKAANRDFEPSSKIKTGTVKTMCKPGSSATRRGEMCVPCEVGTVYQYSTKQCVPCPLGSHMPFEGRDACIPCPHGSTTTKPGSIWCHVCTDGYYGKQCKQRCQCVHGKCDIRTGDCTCESGWEGERCDIDTDGCREASCFPGVQCIDVKAPGTGFRCERCPEGYTGDGAVCTRT